ncbi:MAG: asparaginase domain-containing protein [Eubacterium sp.]
MYPIVQNIFLLQTGGTIGSAIDGHCIDIDPTKGDVLIQTYQKSPSHLVNFEVSRPFTILSENAVPSHWAEIIDVLKNVDFSQYKGIIITHGSDTLPYTAAALSYFFNASPIPIVLVCANYPLGHPKSNGLSNFSGAIDFILNAEIPGIFAIYKNSDGKTQIHLGSRLLEADWIHDDFQSFGGKPFVISDRHCLNHGQSKLSPSIEALKNRSFDTIWGNTPNFKRTILGLRAYPGLDYRYIDLKNDPPAAILHALYHCGSGNASSSEGFSLADFIANHPETDHYLISYKNTESALYATCLKLIENGGIPLENISFEAAITKLYFAYNQSVLSPEIYMKKERFFEFL